MKTIALFSENAREYGRQFLKGVAHYALGRRNWRLRLLSPGEIGNRRAFAGVDGIIARIVGTDYVAKLRATGLPIVDAICETDDPALIGVDNDDLLCSYASVAISSIDPNAFGVGHAAARLMDAALSHPERPKARPTFKVKPGTLVERTSTAVFPVDPPWFATALSYIETHMSSPVSTVDAARAAGVSQTALQTAFHANFGMSAGKYIRGVKMREARRLIATSELSVKEIAARTGFVSHPHFSRTYHAHFGLPPSHPVSD